MKRSPALALGTVLASGTAMLAFAQPSVAADHASEPKAGPVNWSAAHGDAGASGTRWTESGTIFPTLKIEGDLEKFGAGCSSLWVKWTHDLAPLPPKKVVTQCGAGSKPVSITLQSYMPTTTGAVAVCEGDAGTSDCGTWESVTSWPVGRHG